MVGKPETPGDPDEQPASEASGRKAFLLRLPPEVHRELRAWAAQELRSVNSHIEYLLRQAIEVRRRGRP